MPLLEGGDVDGRGEAHGDPVRPDAAGIDGLHEAGFDVLALALTDGAVPLDEVDLGPDRKVALVLGAEGHGLKPATLSAVDEHVVIPMAGGVDSLNVAAASAVVFWQRRAMLAQA